MKFCKVKYFLTRKLLPRSQQKDYPMFYLNFGTGQNKKLEAGVVFDFHIGEQFKYNSRVYNIVNIKHHWKEGFAPYTEIMLVLSENEPDIQWVRTHLAE